MPTVRLHDGRLAGYAAWGPRDGRPVVYLHGLLGSPLRGRAEIETLLWELGLRWIALQRPGFGRSSPAGPRTVAAFAHDVEQAADALGLGRFGVVGVSAGSPYALACAALLRDRVAGLALVGALAPPDVAALRHEGALGQRAACRALARSRLPGRGGAAAEDLRTIAAPWGFAVADAACPVRLWHGTADTTVGLAHARWLAAALPDARTTLCAGEGHFLLRARLAQVLAGLAGRYSSRSRPTKPPRSATRTATATKATPTRPQVAASSEAVARSTDAVMGRRRVSRGRRSSICPVAEQQLPISAAARSPPPAARPARP